MKIIKILKISFLLMLAVSILLSTSAPAFAEVKGNVYEWQINNYDWTMKEFPGVIEEHLAPKEDLKSKSADDLYSWQLKPFEWSQNDKDFPPPLR